ncbi:metabotropic glutamate receptor 1-like [Dendronephthya gigantea]|uniref:metabotropic glutamate receptor 1-like n=1 Tax=Dendronephthya gigantea TaxID=151771 RepID=UPI001068F635|nr:metabotropic glutamate receptor 1-like [Dendronephthya gigantea]
MAILIKNFNNIQLLCSDAIGYSWLLDYISRKKTEYVYISIKTNIIKDFRDYLENLSAEKMNMVPWFKRVYQQIMNCSFKTERKRSRRCHSNQTFGKTLSSGFPKDSTTNVIDAVYVFAHGLHQELTARCPNLANCAQNGNVFGASLLKLIRNSSFQSADGRRVYIDQKGDVTGGYAFEYITTRKDGTRESKIIGDWQGRLSLNLNSIYNSGLTSAKAQCSEPCKKNEIRQRNHEKPCCWKCVECQAGSIARNETICHPCGQGYLANQKKAECVKIQDLFYSLDERISNLLVVPPLVLSALGLLGILFTLSIFIRFHSNPLIKASGRELCYLVLTGLLFSLIFPILCVFRPSGVKCLSQFILDSLPLTISLVPILMKTNRVVRIFDPARRITDQPSLAGSLPQLVLSNLLISLQIIFLLVLVLLHFPDQKLVYFSPTEVHLVCSTTNSQLLVAHLYNVILIIACTYYGFRARNIPSNFNEAKSIAFAMYASCVSIVVFFVAFLVVATGSSNKIIQQALHSYRVSLLANVILFCFFAPKIYIILFRRQLIQRHLFSFNGGGTTVCYSQGSQGYVRNSRTSEIEAPKTIQRSQVPTEMPICRKRQDWKRWTI